jgi:Protein of unknown function (DUF2889)
LPDSPPRYPLARNPLGVAPLRRPGSVRRTTSIDTHWPEGWGKPSQMQGRGRDLLTPSDSGSAATVLADDQFTITASIEREILAISTTPDRPEAQGLQGVRAGGASRDALSKILGPEKGGPLYQVIDDFAGASLVSGWIWSVWESGWQERMQAMRDLPNFRARKMEGICTGFAPGASSLDEEGLPNQSHSKEAARVGPLANPDDPEGWHDLPDREGVQMRRARRIDVWRDEGSVQIDAMFQDSGTTPDGESRAAIHEYHVRAAMNAEDETLLAISVDPRILPFQECPGAALNAGRMVGQPMSDFRQKVLETLPGIHGCTHLNDVLRALSDVPHLASLLA